MSLLRQMRRNAAGVAILASAAASIGVGLWAPRGAAAGRTLQTGAGFSISVAQSSVAAHAAAISNDIQAAGLPAFTRAIRHGATHQVVVGPYVSIEEAEGAQRALARRGFHGRLLVDESVRRIPGFGGVPQASSGVGIVLVAAAGRLSLVVELPSEPRQVINRTSSYRDAAGIATLELDAGPVSVAVPTQAWSAPFGIDVLDQVEVQSVGPVDDRLVRLRMVLLKVARHNVRVVGRRLYIDVWMPQASTPSDARTGPSADRPRADLKVGPYKDDAMPASIEPPDRMALDYREMMQPAATRLVSMEPFVLSAIATPSPEVLGALEESLEGLEEWMRGISAPPEFAATHRSLLAGAGLAHSALEADYAGDRAARVREAFAIVRQQAIHLQQ